MTHSADPNARPTARQLAYLKALAARAGQSFTWPQTRSAASREIRRLKAIPASDALPVEFDLEAERATREANADVPVHGFEIAGYSYGDLERALMMPPTVTEIRRNGNPVGERVELGRYSVPAAGERVIYGQRLANVARLLPGELVVVVRGRIDSDDDIRRSRRPSVAGVHRDAVRPKRRNCGRSGGGGSCVRRETG